MEMAERSLFRVWLSYTFNNLQVTDGCVSPSKYVQVILIMGCILGCGDPRLSLNERNRECLSISRSRWFSGT